MSVDYGREVLAAEIAALTAVRERIDHRFVAALDILQTAKGRIVTCGMGKAGIIAQKIAATLSSTGSPAFFLHPADALHGDLGVVRVEDVAFILSNSGESDEVTRLLPSLRRLGVKIIGITGNERSTLAGHADVVLSLGNLAEACPLGLAPTATTTAMLALGDAVALALMQRKNFQVSDYAQVHPAGTLGRKTMPIEDAMRVGDAVATVRAEAAVADAVLAITTARAGAAVVVDEDDRVIGIFCDGDLRRAIKENVDVLRQSIETVMTKNCTTILAGTLAGEVLEQMREKRISEVPIVDAGGRLVGLADLKGMVASL